MKITVEVSGWLKKYTQEKPNWELDINNQGLCASDVINMVGIPKEEIGFITVKKTGFDREQRIDNNYPVSEGDVLRLYSVIIGG